jgi:hypothetical protein
MYIRAYIIINHLVGGFKHLDDFPYGMSSWQNWRSPSFFKMGTLHHQPVMINRNILEYNQIYRTKKWKITDQQRFFGDFQSDHQRSARQKYLAPIERYQGDPALRLVLSWDQEHRCIMPQGLKASRNTQNFQESVCAEISSLSLCISCRKKVIPVVPWKLGTQFSMMKPCHIPHFDWCMFMSCSSIVLSGADLSADMEIGSSDPTSMNLHLQSLYQRTRIQSFEVLPKVA